MFFVLGRLHFWIRSSSFFGLGRLHFLGEVIFHFQWGFLPFPVWLSSILDEVVFHFGTIGSGIDRHTYRQSELQKLLSEKISLICPSINIILCTNLLIILTKFPSNTGCRRSPEDSQFSQVLPCSNFEGSPTFCIPDRSHTCYIVSNIFNILYFLG